MTTSPSYGATDHAPQSNIAPNSANTAANAIGNGDPNGSGVLPTIADGTVPEMRKGMAVKLWAQKEIDTQRATVISVVNCFLTGFTSAVAFTACYVW